MCDRILKVLLYYKIVRMEKGVCLYYNMYLPTLFGILGTITFHVVNLLFLNRKKSTMSRRALEAQSFFAKKAENNPKLKIFGNITFWAVIETILFSFIHYNYIGYVNTSFGNMVGTGSNYFGMLFVMPVVMMAIYCFMGVDPLAQFDIVTPALPAALVFVKLSCFFEGCCYGIQSPYGVYFSDRGLFEVPVQLIESFNALVLFLFLLVYKKFAKKGTMYPVYVFFYCLTRFFSEFLRREKNILWIFKTYHILCFIGIVLGAVAFVLVLKRRQQLENFLYKCSYKGKKSKQ